MTANDAPDMTELALLYTEGEKEFDALDEMRQEFVCVVVRAVRKYGLGKAGPVELKTDDEDYYAYPHPAGCVAWGINVGKERFCGPRGLWAPDKILLMSINMDRKRTSEEDVVMEHFIRFFRPMDCGDNGWETTISGWDVAAAVEAAKRVAAAKTVGMTDILWDEVPYGFKFVSRDHEGRELRISSMYYLGGIVRTLEQMEADGRADEQIPISDMRTNGWERIVIKRTGPFKWHKPLFSADVVLDMSKFEQVSE